MRNHATAKLKYRFCIITFTSLALLLLCHSTSVGARTLLDSSPAHHDAVISEKFQREFDASGLKPDDHLVILIAASDGAVISVNGHEVGRTNMPTGSIAATTLAKAPLDDKSRGLFIRFQVSVADVITSGKNVIETDVHAASAANAHLSCDLQLKTLPSTKDAPALDADARKALEMFRKENYIAAGTRLPDGYFDGGRHMALDAQEHATSGREILLVDRAHDPELGRDLAFARATKDLEPMLRAQKLAIYVDELSTPLGGRQLLEPTVKGIEQEYANKLLRIGDVVDQCHAGVCRHRSLLFKLLADEAGLKCALVRGNYVHLHSSGSSPHAWNELQLDDGRRFLVDTTLHPRDKFPEITTSQITRAEVAKRYVKVDMTPFYKSSPQ